MSTETNEQVNGSYALHSEPQYDNFQNVEVTERDESKPW